jgi:hypothetical protein
VTVEVLTGVVKLTEAFAHEVDGFSVFNAVYVYEFDVFLTTNTK